MKKEREARESAIPDSAPLTESERAELMRLRAESKDKDAENAELRMQVELAKKWRPGSRKESSEVCCHHGLG